MNPKIILASSSQYRQKLLKQICLDFDCISPEIDESRLTDEPITQMVERLSKEKASAVAAILKDNSQQTYNLIIGSDQAAEFEGKLIGKPRSHEAALEHLISVSGKKMTLQTGLALLNTMTDKIQSTVIPFTVHYRKFNHQEAENYLALDKPYDCAGSLKVESYGIGLIEKMEGNDPNALIGLPLIELTTMLRAEQYCIL